MDDFGLLVGRYLSSLPSLTNLQVTELLLDVNGRLVISGSFYEDAAHSPGDPGLHVMGVRNDADATLVDTDGDYAPLQVDENGRLKVVADIETSTSSEKEEDSEHNSGDIGAYILAVRSDSRPTNASTDTDGDYASVFVNVNGELYVHDTDSLAKLTEIDSELDAQGLTLDNVETSISNIEQDISDFTQVEDSVHSSGDSGVMPLAVRHDAGGSLSDTDGDYTPLQTDSEGQLRVVADAELDAQGTEAFSVTDGLIDNQDGLITITAAATPWITVASLAVGTGTEARMYGYQWACDQNAQMRIITNDTTNIKVYKVDINSSAMPGNNEHFSESGRIEIPGATDLSIQMQIKKRTTSGEDALGTGSMHIRTS